MQALRLHGAAVEDARLQRHVVRRLDARGALHHAVPEPLARVKLAERQRQDRVAGELFRSSSRPTASSTLPCSCVKLDEQERGRERADVHGRRDARGDADVDLGRVEIFLHQLGRELFVLRHPASSNRTARGSSPWRSDRSAAARTAAPGSSSAASSRWPSASSLRAARCAFRALTSSFSWPGAKKPGRESPRALAAAARPPSRLPASRVGPPKLSRTPSRNSGRPAGRPTGASRAAPRRRAGRPRRCSPPMPLLLTLSRMNSRGGCS